MSDEDSEIIQPNLPNSLDFWERQPPVEFVSLPHTVIRYQGGVPPHSNGLHCWITGEPDFPPGVGPTIGGDKDVDLQGMGQCTHRYRQQPGRGSNRGTSCWRWKWASAARKGGEGESFSGVFSQGGISSGGTYTCLVAPEADTTSRGVVGGAPWERREEVPAGEDASWEGGGSLNDISGVAEEASSAP